MLLSLLSLSRQLHSTYHTKSVDLNASTNSLVYRIHKNPFTYIHAHVSCFVREINVFQNSKLFPLLTLVASWRQRTKFSYPHLHLPTMQSSHRKPWVAHHQRQSHQRRFTMPSMSPLMRQSFPLRSARHISNSCSKWVTDQRRHLHLPRHRSTQAHTRRYRWWVCWATTRWVASIRQTQLFHATQVNFVLSRKQQNHQLQLAVLAARQQQHNIWLCSIKRIIIFIRFWRRLWDDHRGCPRTAVSYINRRSHMVAIARKEKSKRKSSNLFHTCHSDFLSYTFMSTQMLTLLSLSTAPKSSAIPCQHFTEKFLS